MFAFKLLTDPSRVDNDIFPLGAAAPHALFRSMWSEEEVQDDLNNLFCSKTVAVCYKHVGLLSKKINANGVFPKHFGHKKDYRLAYVNAKLSYEVEISFAPKLIFDLKDKLLAQPYNELKKMVNPAERSTMVVQRCARRWLARRTLLKRQKEAAELDAELLGGTKRYGPGGPTAREMRRRFSELSRIHAELLEGIVDEAEAHPDDITDEEMHFSIPRPNIPNPVANLPDLPNIPGLHVPANIPGFKSQQQPPGGKQPTVYGL